MNAVTEQKNIEQVEIPNFQVLNNKQSRDLLQLRQPYRFNGSAVLLIKGKASIEIDNIQYEYENTYIQVWLFSHIKLLNLANDVDLRMVFIPTGTISEPKFFTDFTYNSVIYKLPCLELDDKVMDEFLRFWNFMHEQQNLTHEKDQKELNKQLVYALFLKQKSIYVERGLLSISIMDSADSTLLHKFLYLIFTHMWKEKTVPFYAEKLNLSTEKLSALVKQEWGDTAENWIFYSRLIQLIAEVSIPSVSMTKVADKFHISLSELEMILKENTPNPSV